MKIDGACHCGQISYTAEIDLETVAICHCTDCQTLSGSAFRTVVPVKREGFHVSGEPKVYVKTAESGRQRAQAFCPECGTPIYATSVADPQLYSLRLGTARQRAELAPRMQQWTRSACGWVDGIAAIPKVEKQRG
ncbi:MAG: GFA family protein [Burkholderiales bacterium]